MDQSTLADVQWSELLGKPGSDDETNHTLARLRVLGQLGIHPMAAPAVREGSINSSSTKALDRRSSQKDQVLSSALDSVAEVVTQLQSETVRNEEAEGTFQVPVENLRVLLRLWDIDTNKTDYHELLAVADYLERLSLDVYFGIEIKEILDLVFRIWTENSLSETASILGDLQVVGLAFYLLRSHEYDVQPSIFQLYQMEDGSFSKTPSEKQGSTGHTPGADVFDLLNLLRASDLKFRRDVILQDAYKFASTTLTRLLDGIQQPLIGEKTAAEIKYRLSYPWAMNFRILETRQTVLNFDVESVTVKFSSSARLSSEVVSLMVSTATQQFNHYHSVFQKEIDSLERWSQETGCEEVNVRSSLLLPCYLGLAYGLPQERYAYLRDAWCKAWYLLVVVDDLFESLWGYSDNELIIFMDAYKQLDPSILEKIPNIQDERYKTMRVQYQVFYDFTKECAEKISEQYGPNVVHTLVDIMIARLGIYFTERKWKDDKLKMSLKQFMEDFSIWSFATEAGLAYCYFLIPGLTMSPSFVKNRPDMEALFTISKTGRILNDARSYQYEKTEGKIIQLVNIIMEEHPELTEDDVCNMLQPLAISALEETTEALLKNVVPYREVKLLDLCFFRLILLTYFTVDGLRNPDWPLSKLCDPLPSGDDNNQGQMMSNC